MTETARKGSDDFFARRAAGLEWLLFDVDGVLTDGTLYYTRRGEAVKPFHVKDGLGLQLARRAGLRLGILSGRRSGAVERRAKDLGFEVVMLGSKDKAADFSKFLERQHTTPGRVAFVGDDLPEAEVEHVRTVDPRAPEELGAGDLHVLVVVPVPDDVQRIDVVERHAPLDGDRARRGRLTQDLPHEPASNTRPW